MNLRLTILGLLLAFVLYGCDGSSDRTYEYPAGYRVTLYLMGGEFSDGTSDRVHGGIMQPTAMKNVLNLVHGEPYLNYDQPFAVWNTDPYGYGKDYTEDTVITDHVTLYAIYGRYIYDEYSLLEVECGNPNAVYVLSDDIITTDPWIPLCPDAANPFKGKIYGKGHSIRYQTVSTGSRVPNAGGLFGYAAGANIGDLVVDADSTGKESAGGIVGVVDAVTFNKVRVTGTVTADEYAGGIVGKMTGESTVINSSFGDIRNHRATATGQGSSAAVGGLVGYMSDGRIDNSSSKSLVDISVDNSAAGGIVGNALNSTVKNCLHSGHITASGGVRMMTGGIVGRLTDSAVSLCYTDSTVQAPERTEGTSSGGIVGMMENSSVSDSLAEGLLVVGTSAGRIVGTYSGELDNNYARNDLLVNYNVTEDGDNNGTGVEHSRLLRSESFYRDRLGMDFRLVWTLPEYYLYPRLEWEEVPEFIKIYDADELDAMRDDLSGWYVLMKDIDLSEWGHWKSVGDSLSPFYGVLNGNGKTISNLDGGALFGYCSTLSVYDLSMINTSGGLASSAGWSYIDRVNITGSARLARTMYPGYVSYAAFDGRGGLINIMRGGILLYSYAAGTSGSLADEGGLVGRAENIVAANNYALMDIYARHSEDSSGGGAFGYIEGSVVNNVYAFGNVTANTNNSTEYGLERLLSAAGGFAGVAIDSDIRDSAAFGDTVSADYYDIYNPYGAESHAGNFTGFSENTIYRNVFSNRNFSLSADYTSGEKGELVDTDMLDEDFFSDYMDIDFGWIWKMPVMGDIRTYPIFQWNWDRISPEPGYEWYWYGIRKYYEDF